MSLSSHSETSESTDYFEGHALEPSTHHSLPVNYSNQPQDQGTARQRFEPSTHHYDHSTERDAGTEARRLSLIAADRKRRLTDSQHGPLRTRTNSGGFHTQEERLSPAGPSTFNHRSGVNLPPPARNMAEPVQSVPDASLMPQAPQRPSVASLSDYNPPTWQPDSEATKCPICGVQFSWYHRKHHCRKCGRVVCGNCSPHRITIPRQFIVRPPDAGQRTSTINPTNVIDLTRDDEDSAPVDEPVLRRPPSSQFSHPGLGGGEEVRLCNPCVPDPQPHTSPAYSPATRPQVPRWPSEADSRNDWDTPRRHSSLTSQDQTAAWLTEQARQELRRRRGRGMIFAPENQTSDAARTEPTEIPDEGLPEYGRFGVTVVPDLQRRGIPPHYRENSNGSRPPGYYSNTPAMPGNQPFRNSMPMPGYLPPSMRRPPSHDVPRFSSQILGAGGSRPRVHSMLDVGTRPSSSVDTSRPARPRLHERDICPICRHALPPIGASGDESDRERHIMDCISARDPTTPTQNHQSNPLSQSASGTLTSPPRLPVPPTPVYMLKFSATEKDCTSEDGTSQECSICMVEYEVGEKLARLECLCKFHEECIQGWFRRKRECPVHKRDEREMV